MRILVGVLSVGVIGLMLAEFFIALMLPRRVKRDPRIARRFFASIWKPWRGIALRLPPVAQDTMLGVYGPLGLLLIIGFLAGGLIVGFAGLQWAHHAHLHGHRGAGFVDQLYFSAASFVSASTTFNPTGGLTKGLQIAEAASGFAVLFISIGYLPALFQAFSRRETAVSQLDPRAGSPPSAGVLLKRSGERGGWEELDDYLQEWETWAAELMETQLSYPVLGYYRSQHVNQNWLAALTTVVDASAFSMAFAPEGSVKAAGFTYAIGRHALSDLTYAVRAPKQVPDFDRLPPVHLAKLIVHLRESSLPLRDGDGPAEKLSELRSGYEHNAIAISQRLALPLPGWLPGEDVVEYWRIAGEQAREDLPGRATGSPRHRI